MTRVPLAVPIALLLLPLPALRGAPPTEQPTYPIHIHTRSTVGERFRIERSTAIVRSSSTDWDGADDQTPVEREAASGYHTVLDKEMLAVDAEDDAAAEKTIVRSWTRTRVDGKEEQVMPPGTEVVARAPAAGSDEPEYTLNGRPAPQDKRAQLDLIAHVSGPDQKWHEQEMYGSSEPRKVGESWPVNAAAVAANLRRHDGQQVTDADVSGTVTLTGVETINDIPCLRLEGEDTVRNYRPSAGRRTAATTRPGARSTPATRPTTTAAAAAAATTASRSDESAADDRFTVTPGTRVQQFTWWVPVDGEGEHQRSSFRTEERYAVSGAVQGRSFVDHVTIEYDSEYRLLSFIPGPTSRPAAGGKKDEPGVGE